VASGINDRQNRTMNVCKPIN